MSSAMTITMSSAMNITMSSAMTITMSSARSPTFPSLHLSHCSFSNSSIVLPTSQLILQPFRRFTYVTAHSATIPLLHLRHSSFSNPSFAPPTSQALHLIHLASRPSKLLYTFNIVSSLIYLLLTNVWKSSYTISESIFVHVTY